MATERLDPVGRSRIETGAQCYFVVICVSRLRISVCWVRMKGSHQSVAPSGDTLGAARGIWVLCSKVMDGAHG